MAKRRKNKGKLIFVFLAVILFFTAGKIYDGINKAIYPLRYEEYINRYSDENGLDRYLVMALIKAESNFIYDAHSGIARGLMQITADTAGWISDKMGIEFSPDDIEDPETNIKMGCFYLKYLLDYYNNDEHLALAAYNAGMGNVNKWLKDPEKSSSGDRLDVIPFSETQRYVEKIEKYKTIYKGLYQNKGSDKKQ